MLRQPVAAARTGIGNDRHAAGAECINIAVYGAYAEFKCLCQLGCGSFVLLQHPQDGQHVIGFGHRAGLP